MAKRASQKVIDLRDVGIDGPSLELTKDEALEKGYFLHDTKKTRLVDFKGEVVEIDFRKCVSSKGDKIVWISGKNPAFIEGRAENFKRNNKLREGKTSGKRKSLASVIKAFMDTHPSKRELDKLPKSVIADLEIQMGGVLTRADIAAFALMGKAMGGDIMAFKELADRVEGKAVQKTENKNLNMNYTDFLADKAGLGDEEDEEEFDVTP